jgi:hypothetical protein
MFKDRYIYNICLVLYPERIIEIRKREKEVGNIFFA